MKFNGWTVDAVIAHLKHLKSTDLFDYHCVPRCFGEIHFYNGEDVRTGEPLPLIDDLLTNKENISDKSREK